MVWVTETNFYNCCFVVLFVTAATPITLPAATFVFIVLSLPTTQASALAMHCPVEAFVSPNVFQISLGLVSPFSVLTWQKKVDVGWLWEIICFFIIIFDIITLGIIFKVHLVRKWSINENFAVTDHGIRITANRRLSLICYAIFRNLLEISKSTEVSLLKMYEYTRMDTIPIPHSRSVLTEL